MEHLQASAGSHRYAGKPKAQQEDDACSTIEEEPAKGEEEEDFLKPLPSEEPMLPKELQVGRGACTLPSPGLPQRNNPHTDPALAHTPLPLLGPLC